MNGSLHKAVLFIDRNSGGLTFRKFIEDAGVVVRLHDDHFAQKTDDDKWLKEIGELGWIMVTGDRKISRTPLFLLRLSQTKARVFILSGLNGETPEGKAKCIISYYDHMLAISEAYEAPMLWRINKDGSRKEIDFRKHLERMKRRRGI